MLKFGTDGWRAIISDEFTFANVEKVAKAIAWYLGGRGHVIVGYDPRFLADKFAETVVKVMETAGLDCLLTERDTPTPIVAWSVKDRKAAGAVMLTASHNPAQYCGLKFIPDYAGPAHGKITAILQEYSNKELALPQPQKRGAVERIEPRDRYFEYIKSFIDPDLIKRAKLKIVYDPMHGSGRGYLDMLLEHLGCQVAVIHGERDVLFGGDSPEPTEEHLEELKAKVREAKADVGLANDGDADRFGIVDETGRYLPANQIVPLVCEYLITDKGYRGSVVRSVATSHFVDRIAARHKIKVHETPVGFKYIAEVMMREKVIIGGEESGGFSVGGHIPEKDGLLACLLVVEMLAKRQKPLSQLWTALVKAYGEVYSQRINLELASGPREALMTRLKNETPEEFAGVKVQSVNKLDGVKLMLADGSWVLARPSGTEPLIRIYLEADSQSKLQALAQGVADLK